ncbi:helix-turn-helix domain-containing protein [Blastococcus sp. MG754426]|uniref:helix-turn-helix domain-containing protein n=1 Tax=unclassified Blastococcus TaxID=2619396 RepID=UPI001EF0D5FD|nr:MULTISPECIES: helix-turn-helix domain-containing protein [unclassified Blastococcus]MCF6507382.1 helix-turn-helix domain-containing protein [Blastococcus sp. MG754426]MCF6511454.1 helix-turn-helix domain-containing protein [Blastococcus sp. MG754427]
MTQPPPWPKRLTATIADQVQRTRVAQGLSAQQLADITAELGYAIPRSVIANLESGRRDTVSVAELIVLARALRIPPLLLALPIGRLDTVELLPGVDAATWPAAKWFAGDGAFPGEGFAASNNSVIKDFRAQDQALDEWRRSKRRADEGRLRLIEESLERIRADIREWGCDPGPLPAELSHLEDENGRHGER